MADKRLIGSDGQLISGSFGTEVSSGTVLTADTWYKVTGIDSSGSVFPSGVVTGLLYKADGTETLATDDKAQPFEGSLLCDIQSWSLDFSKGDIDVTTMCDGQKVSRAGKTDVTGSIEGVMTIGVTDDVNGFQNRFVSIVKQDGSTYTVSLANDAVFYVQLFTDATTTTGEIESFYFMPIAVTGFSASAGGEDAQTFSSPFKVAPSDEGVMFYEYTV